MADMSERPLDIVVFGSTGDTGSIGCCWLYCYGKKLGIRNWAPAARNLDKLKKEVLDRLPSDPGAEGMLYEAPIKADAGDYNSLLEMCKMTKLVVACAGPFEKYGEPVVKACAEVGTNYVDVTGEYAWVGEMEAKYGAQALEKGVSMVSMAGYDSVPSDLSTFLCAQTMKDAGESIQRCDLFFHFDGPIPSGSVETALLMADSAREAFYGCLTCGLCGTKKKKVADPKTDALELGDPLRDEEKVVSQFVPQTEMANMKANTSANSWPSYSSLGGRFSVLHFMAPINVNTVYRTAAQEGYGGLVYREKMDLGAGCCSLFYMLFTLLIFINGILLILTPCGGYLLKSCFLSGNPKRIQATKDSLFKSLKSTGGTAVTGFAVSKSGKMKVNVKMESKYDPGLGFTMQTVTMIASEIVKRCVTDKKPRAGVQTAVRCLGAETLVEGLKKMGVQVEVHTQK